MEQFDRIRAVFRPKRTDDLREGMAEWIGRESTYQASWIIEEGDYAGDWAMGQIDFDGPCMPCSWVPLCDLERSVK